MLLNTCHSQVVMQVAYTPDIWFVSVLYCYGSTCVCESTNAFCFRYVLLSQMIYTYSFSLKIGPSTRAGLKSWRFSDGHFQSLLARSLLRWPRHVLCKCYLNRSNINTQAGHCCFDEASIIVGSTWRTTLSCSMHVTSNSNLLACLEHLSCSCRTVTFHVCFHVLPCRLLCCYVFCLTARLNACAWLPTEPHQYCWRSWTTCWHH